MTKDVRNWTSSLYHHAKEQAGRTDLPPTPNLSRAKMRYKLSHVIKFEVGSLIHLWWAKDGNPEDVRINGDYVLTYKRRNVTRKEMDMVFISADDPDLDSVEVEIPDDHLDSESTDMSGRGEIYFSPA